MEDSNLRPFVFGIIPARGGSKGVKNKNIRLVKNEPLINYTIEAAKKSQMLDKFIVSTDSEEIREVAIAAGAEVPFIRPSEYASDQASMVSVIDHALKWRENSSNLKVDVFVLLQPTTPLRSSKDIDLAIELILSNQEADSLISCCDATHVHPVTMYEFDGKYMRWYTKNKKMIRRQEFPPTYVRNGCIYITRSNYFFNEKRLVNDTPLGYIMPRWRSVNIDDELDFRIAEYIYKQRK